MKRSPLALSILLGMAAGGAVPAANLQEPIVLDLQFKVLDLVSADWTIVGEIKDLEVKETATEIRIELAADVLFEFDKAVLLPKAETTLTQAAALIAERGAGSTVRIEGHTDSKGDDSYNQKLSERRAAAVKAWFVTTGGLAGASFATQGLGEKIPKVANERRDGSDDPESRQKNRRVEIIVKKG